MFSLVGRPLSSGYGSTRYNSGVKQYFGSSGQGEMSNFNTPAQEQKEAHDLEASFLFFSDGMNELAFQ